MSIESIVDSVLLESLARSVIGGKFVLIYCLAIVLGLIVISLYFHTRVSLVKRQINRAIKELSAITDESEFASRFEEFNRAILLKYPIIAHAWKEYTENLVFPDQTISDKIIRNSRQSDEYFSFQSLVATTLRLSFFNIFPNILTGLGILGTFIGLAAGIFLASDAMMAADLEQVKSGLSDLLGGASLAFLTSICGLASSMAFSFGKQRLLSDAEITIDKWNREVDRHVQFLTVEKMAGKLQAELEAQTHHLKKFNTDLAVSIADALDEKVAGRLMPSIDKMIAAIEGLRADRGDSTEKLLENVVEKFQESLSGATGSQFQSMAETLSRLDQTISQSANTLQSFQEESEKSTQHLVQSISANTQSMRNGLEQTFNSGAAAFQQQVSQGIQQLTEITKKMAGGIAGELREASQSAATSMTNALSGFKTRVEELDHTADRIDAIISGSRDQLIQTKEVNDQLASILRTTQSTLQSIEQTGASLSALSEASERNLEQNKVIAEALHNSVQSIQATQDRFKQIWEEYRQRFEGVDKSLQNVFEELDSRFESYKSRVIEFSTRLDAETAKGMQHLRGVIEELQSTLDDLSDTLGKAAR